MLETANGDKRLGGCAADNLGLIPRALGAGFFISRNRGERSKLCLLFCSPCRSCDAPRDQFPAMWI